MNSTGSDDVRTQWVGERSDLAKRTAYEQMRSKYLVVLPAPPADAPNDATTPQAATNDEAPQ